MAITRYEPWSLLNQLQRELLSSQDEKPVKDQLQLPNGRLRLI